MGSLVFVGLLVLLVLLALGILVALKGRLPATGVEEPAFEARNHLFTPAERSFLGVLEQAVAGEFKVFGKVRLGDLIQPAKGQSQSQRTRSRNRIQQKHVDFVLCQPCTFAVAGVVELDDASHGRKDRVDRDDFVDKALASAGVPVLHLPARKGYSVAEVRAKLIDSLSLKVVESESLKVQETTVTVPAEEPAAQASQSLDAPVPESESVVPTAAEPLVTESPVVEPPVAPVCPACSSAMVKRQAKKGQYAGRWFWACSGYPGCKKIVAVG